MIIKVIHTAPAWLPQTQTWMFTQAKQLPEERVECHVVCETTQNLEQFPFPRIHCLAKASPLRFYWDKGLRKLKVRHYLGFLVQQANVWKADIIHSHFGNIGWADRGAVRQAGVRHIVTFYGLDVNKLPNQDARWKKRYQDLFSGVDRVLCEGPHMARCIEALGCPMEKLRVHHLGVEIDRIPFRPRQWQPGNPLRVLISASFREKKGIPHALEALAGIQKTGVADVFVTLIGEANQDASSQREKQRILETIGRYGLHERVRMLGYQSYERLLSEAYEHHLFLSPSITASDGDTEGGAPVTLIDMAASGMPIVSTTHCDIPEVVIHEQTGRLASEGDIDGLVKQLLWWLEHPETWRVMLDAGRQHVKQEYDAVTQGKKLAEIYETTAFKTPRPTCNKHNSSQARPISSG